MHDAASRALRSITIATQGSRGDIQPFIAVATKLQDAGYKVRIITNSSRTHVDLLQSFELTHVPIFSDFENGLTKDAKLAGLMNTGDAQHLLEFLTKPKSEEEVRYHSGIFKLFLEEMKTNTPDLFIAGSFCEYLFWFVSVILKVPSISMHVSRIYHNPEHAFWGFPTLPLGLHYFAYKKVIAKHYQHIIQYDQIMSPLSGGGSVVKTILPSSAQYLDHMTKPRVPIILFQSTTVRDILHPSAHPNLKFVGCTLIGGNDQTANNRAFGGSDTHRMIEAFLSADGSRKPVYCGWGSMTCKSSEQMALLAVRALQLCGRRGIVLGGWADIDVNDLVDSDDDGSAGLIEYARRNILFVRQAPHGYLFPRVACTVHHGGSGTLAAALRSGVPTIVTPIILDQFDHAYVVSKLKIGFGFDKNLNKVSAEELAAVIERVTNSSSMKQKAEEIGKKLRCEDGASNAVDEIESFWKEYGQNEKFHKVLMS